MERFVEERHGRKQHPELEQITRRLCGEVVELKTVTPYLPQPACPHPRHNSKHSYSQQREPPGINPAQARIDPRNEVVSMRPLGDDDVREIDCLGALALKTLAAQFLLQCDVPFRRTLVKQVCVRLEEGGKFTY